MSNSVMVSVLATNRASPDSGPSGGAVTGLAKPAGCSSCCCSVTVSSSRFGHIAGVVGEDFIQGGVLAPDGYLQLERRAHGGHLARVHDRHPVAEIIRFFHVMRRQEDGRAGPGAELG